MKRLFVSDLDGTLLNQEAEITAYTANVINAAIEKGLNFTISTARTPATALKILYKLNLQLPIMLMNGAIIYDMKSKQFIKKEVLSDSVVMVLLGLIKVKGLDCFLYGLSGESFYAYYDSANSKSLNYFRNERIMKYDKKFVEVEDLSLVKNKDIVYCMLREPKEKLDGLYRDLSVVKGVQTAYYPDIYNEEYYMLEIYSDKASKKHALDYLRTEGSYDSVTGFGDNLNDIGIYEASDYFYAVANAHPDMQKKADAVIPSNLENGVAKYIEQMMLQEEF
ncbi:MAG: HAD-IIB family hydrolase [Lachnospiraceae bacterium]